MEAELLEKKGQAQTIMNDGDEMMLIVLSPEKLPRTLHMTVAA
jgi:hypothetical protein